MRQTIDLDRIELLADDLRDTLQRARLSTDSLRAYALAGFLNRHGNRLQELLDELIESELEGEATDETILSS